MLRRKLFVLLGSLIAILVIGAVGALLTLHHLMLDLSAASRIALEQTERTAEVAATLTTIEAELNALRLAPTRDTLTLRTAADALGRAVDRIAPALGVPTTKMTRAATTVANAGSELRARLDDVIRSEPGSLRTTLVDERLGHALATRKTLVELGRQSLEMTETEQAGVMSRFRWTAAGLGLAYLLVINVTIMILLRAAHMVLAPVDELVEANRRLAQEDFGHRAQVHSEDEFGELARATNRLAEQLQSNEQRKLETLQQVARTLNHELNNAMSIIDIQLELVGRRAAEDPTQVGRLEEIHHALQRMSSTVDALKRVRRIVLTDYIEGVKMLDLERSVEDEPVGSPPLARTGGGEP